MIDRLAIGFVAAIVIVGGAWWHGHSTASGQCQADKLRKELADTRVQLETLQRVVSEQAEIMQADTEAAKVKADELANLREMNADLVNSIADGACFDDAESDAIRKRLESAR